jgi:hypothetical protein
MLSIVLGENATTGVTTVVHYDGGKVHVEKQMHDVEPIIERNKAMATAQRENGNRWGDYAFVGSLPLSIYLDLRQKGIIDDPREWAKWCARPENRAWLGHDKAHLL